MEKLALLGGTPVIDDTLTKEKYDHLFKWPIMGKEEEEVAIDVVRNNRFSATDITEKFQEEYAAWIGSKYAIAYCNGTASLSAAMFAIGLSQGDEIICPTKTYWGSVSQAINFGASAVFCNINENLSLDPTDLERCITPKTKAIMVVHYLAYPADMDAIMAIAKKHNLKVIEDVSHAQGGMYKGKRLGTFGDVGAMSLMSGKSFAAGELGILVTDDRHVYERAMAFGHYERNNENYIKESDELKGYYHIALGGIKGRANQLCSGIARVQLKYYDERCAEIRKAMNYFWDLVEDLPGIRPIRVDESTGSNMAGFYSPHGIYKSEELHGLSVKKFCEALRAEGYKLSWEGANFCLHTHKFFKTFDLTGSGKPTRIAYNDRDVREDDDKCKPSESISCFSVPWFIHYDKEWIEKYASIFRKVILNHEQLLESDTDKSQGGRWYGTTNV
ncbi:MAG: aminotransferase class I/II-fold pyridoxal phosphate-dependent enzyme [Clostridia bacterium]|nr:aminotransferase class I/II-fold pyridoxal phosphate-dependent enzyme [Clostridia bacterium]